MEKIYNTKDECVGCRACEQICPRGCITMICDEEGFFYPSINDKICINCSMCKEICKTSKKSKRLNSNEKNQLKCFAAKHKEKTVLLQSTSGGVFFSLAKYVISKQGYVFGAVYDEEFNVHHMGTNCIDDVKKMMGSKYVQSDTQNTFHEVYDILQKEEWVLYTGTPCQIAGLKAFLGKNYRTLICVSLICHGVPSPMVWQRYIQYIKGIYGEKELLDVKFRSKEMWEEKGSHMIFKFKERTIEKNAAYDLYNKAFGNGIDLRPSCYHCNFHIENNVADIIIGDFWGADKEHPRVAISNGISAIILCSSIGYEVWENIKDDFYYEESTYEAVLRGNPRLESSLKVHKDREVFFEELNKTGNLIEAFDKYLNTSINKEERYIYQYPIIMTYLKNKLRGISVSDLLRKKEVTKIALYAVTEFTELIMSDIDNRKFEYTIYDKNPGKFAEGFFGKEVFGVNALVTAYENKEIDFIIICSVFHINEIFADFLKLGISLEDMQSVTELIYLLSENT